MLKSALSSLLVATVFSVGVNSLAPQPSIAGSSNLQRPGATVTVYGVNYDGHNFTGQVLNRSGKRLSFLRLYYQILDGQGRMMDMGKIYIMEDELKGSQNGSFQGFTQKIGTHLIFTSAEWSD